MAHSLHMVDSEKAISPLPQAPGVLCVEAEVH